MKKYDVKMYKINDNGNVHYEVHYRRWFMWWKAKESVMGSNPMKVLESTRLSKADALWNFEYYSKETNDKPTIQLLKESMR